MNYVDRAKQLITRHEVKEASKNLLEDALAALLGDPVAIAKLVFTLGSSPFFIRDQLFWSKLEMFLNGVYIEDEDRAKLCAKLTANGKKHDTQARLIECIDRAETESKIQYLINATRCLLSDFVTLEEYFRICHAVTHTLSEDLTYLRAHIFEENLEYNNNIQGLFSSGLMYQSVLGDNIGYSFTPVAFSVDMYAVSYEDIARYPNPISGVQKKTILSVNISSIDEQILDKAFQDRTASDAEVKEVLDTLFGTN